MASSLADELTSAMSAARTEAKAAFGVGDVYIEKYIKTAPSSSRSWETRTAHLTLGERDVPSRGSPEDRRGVSSPP